jgi:acyl carrier protein
MAEIGEILPRVKTMLVERLFLDVAAGDIGDDDDLVKRFGVDSVRIFEVVVGLEETFGVSFADEDFSVERFATPRLIAGIVAAKGS